MKKVFKFRAEISSDVDRLKEVLVMDNLKSETLTAYSTKLEKEVNLPDVEIEFESELSLIEIQRIMDTIEDGHVMFETVALIEDYTGERNYDLQID